jgi:hypothetical protein
VKVAERDAKLAQMVAEACSDQAHRDASSHGRQLRPLHVLDTQRKQMKRVTCPSAPLSFSDCHVLRTIRSWSAFSPRDCPCLV